MTESYLKNKASIYKWREKNRERVNAYNAKLMKNKYVHTLPYNYETACRRLRKINSNFFF